MTIEAVETEAKSLRKQEMGMRAAGLGISVLAGLFVGFGVSDYHGPQTAMATEFGVATAEAGFAAYMFSLAASTSRERAALQGVITSYKLTYPEEATEQIPSSAQ